jgi:glycosyltransferase involved in cell wall biosynthesis
VRSAGISFCTIVRDAADTLSQCLRSVADLADELIVVDTGSTDESAEVARTFGARVVEVPWRRDFAAARNEYLKVARGAWILSLDSDEALDALDSVAFRASLGRLPATALVFTIRNYFSLSDDHPPLVLPSALAVSPWPGIGCALTRTVRLFPRRQGIRYHYPINETLRPSLGGVPFRLCNVPIHHMGYLRGCRQREVKARLYRELTVAKAASHPDSFLGHFELGKLLLSDGDLEAAARCFTRCLHLHPRFLDGHYFLALTLLRSRRLEHCRECLVAARKRFPDRRDLLDLWRMLELEEVAGARLSLTH